MLLFFKLGKTIAEVKKMIDEDNNGDGLVQSSMCHEFVKFSLGSVWMKPASIIFGIDWKLGVKNATVARHF